MRYGILTARKPAEVRVDRPPPPQTFRHRLGLDLPEGGGLMSFAILGLGTALPECPVTQDRAAELTRRISGHDQEQSRGLAILYRRTGIGKRHVTLLDQAGQPPLADATCARDPRPTGA